MRDGEKHFQQLAESNLRRVVHDLNGLSMSRFAAADLLVIRILHIAAGVAGRRAADAFHVLKNSLNSPETSARDDNGFLPFLRAEGFVHRGIRNYCGRAGVAVPRPQKERPHNQKKKPKKRGTSETFCALFSSLY